MKIYQSVTFCMATLLASNVAAWEAVVTDILHHIDHAAIYLNPDPGANGCGYGSPYLLVLDGSNQSNQRFSMLLTALSTGKTISGFQDGCSSAI